MYSFYPDKWWTEEVAKEHLEECSDQELEEFLLKSKALIIHLVPEPDDWNHMTIAGLVITQYMMYNNYRDSNGDLALSVYIIIHKDNCNLFLPLEV